MTRFGGGHAARLLAVAALGVAASPAAKGFYFAGWPGDGRPRQPVTLTPLDRLTAGDPPSVWARVPETVARRRDEADAGDPRVGRRDGGDGPGGPAVPVVPEPGTLGLVAVGAGVVVARWVTRRRP